MLLARWMEEWWGSVMDVGLNPELTKWSVRSGSAIVLTGKGYKEHHWLVVPPSTTSVISTLPLPSLTLLCQCPLAPFPALKTSTAGAVPQFVFGAKLAIVRTWGGPLPPSYLTKKVIA